MREVKDFGTGCSQFRGTEEELLVDEGYLKLKEVHDYLKKNGSCHVRVTGGDYDGSIALFTLNNNSNYEENLYKRIYSRERIYSLKYYWQGRLSWEGKRNNPQFTLMNSTCEVLLDYDGPTSLKRFNLKEEKKKLLQDVKIEDIDGHIIEIGDKVLYMNLRYGSGGSLCHGVVHDFKAHARQGYVSVIVREVGTDIESDLNFPSSQIYKK